MRKINVVESQSIVNNIEPTAKIIEFYNCYNMKLKCKSCGHIFKGSIYRIRKVNRACKKCYLAKRPKIRKTLEHRLALSEATVKRFQNIKERKKSSEAAIKRFMQPGSKNYLKNPQRMNRTRQTCMERYGISSPLKNKENTPSTLEFYLSRGLSLKKAKQKQSEFNSNASKCRQNITSHWSIDYWIAKGFTNQQALKKISQIQITNARKSNFTKSKIATKFIKEFSSISGYKIYREFKIGRKIVDGFIKPNIVIEIFGDYWHCNPTLYNKNFYHRRLCCTAGEKWRDDRRRIRYLERRGYKVYIIWETDIRNNSDIVLNKLITEILK